VPVFVASGQPHADGFGMHPVCCVGLGVGELVDGLGTGGVVGTAVDVVGAAVGAAVGDGETVALGDGEAVCVALGVGVGPSGTVTRHRIGMVTVPSEFGTDVAASQSTVAVVTEAAAYAHPPPPNSSNRTTARTRPFSRRLRALKRKRAPVAGTRASSSGAACLFTVLLHQ
jgi:hypothetical protein